MIIREPDFSFRNCRREIMTMAFLFRTEQRPGPEESDEYSTPSLITLSAWSTCDGCGEGDEDSAPSSALYQ